MWGQRLPLRGQIETWQATDRDGRWGAEGPGLSWSRSEVRREGPLGLLGEKHWVDVSLGMES